MQIVHVTRQFHPAYGGLETVVDNLARRQVQRGHKVRVITLNRIFGSDQCLPRKEILNGVEIIRLRFFGSRRYPIAPAVLGHLQGADIVHVHAVDFFFDFLSLTQFWHRKKLVLSTHGGFFHTAFASLLKKLYFTTITRFNLARYAFVAASSDQDLAAFRDIRSRGIETIASGIEYDKFADLPINRRAKQLIYFGRLAENKNVFALIPFFSALLARDPDWTLVMAGRPMSDMSKALRMAAQDAGCEERVSIIENPSTSRLRDAIRQSSIFVSPSSYEGFGIAALEALAAGLFPALSDIPPHRQTVEGAGIGCLIDFRNPTEAASRVFNDWSRWATDKVCSRTLPTYLQQFSWERSNTQFEALYHRVVGMTHRNILGAPIVVTQSASVWRTLDDAVSQRSALRVAFVNANLANHMTRNAGLSSALRGFCLLNDGFGVDLASKFLYGNAFPENLNGTDFTPDYLDHSRHRLRIYLLGAKTEVIADAARIFANRWPQHIVVGFHDGYLNSEDERRVADDIKTLGPDVVLVGMGNPRQELWLSKYVPQVAPVGIGVGALFDFQVGRFKRAPVIMRKVRLEWLYRLCLEPKRLWRRYILGNAFFLGRVALQYARGERA